MPKLTPKQEAGLKRCTGCGAEKAAHEFARHRRDGLTSRCKVCHAAQSRAYAAKNKAKVLAATKAWRLANAETLAQAQAERRKTEAYKPRPPVQLIAFVTIRPHNQVVRAVGLEPTHPAR